MGRDRYFLPASAAQTARIASSSPSPSGTAGPGRLAKYHRRPSSGDRTVRLPGICRNPFGSVFRTQSQAYRSHFVRYSFGWWANQLISSYPYTQMPPAPAFPGCRLAP